jgi:cytochrome P450
MTVHDHARRIARAELGHRRLASLTPADRAAVEELAASLAAALADALVETAAGEPALAGALATIYGAELSADARLALGPV